MLVKLYLCYLAIWRPYTFQKNFLLRTDLIWLSIALSFETHQLFLSQPALIPEEYALSTTHFFLLLHQYRLHCKQIISFCPRLLSSLVIRLLLLLHFPRLLLILSLLLLLWLQLHLLPPLLPLPLLLPLLPRLLRLLRLIFLLLRLRLIIIRILRLIILLRPLIILLLLLLLLCALNH